MLAIRELNSLGCVRNFDKTMIDLVREIRRQVCNDDRDSIKFSNPELLSALMPIYRATPKPTVKALIKKLFLLAGENWAEPLDDNKSSTQSYLVYRGQRLNKKKISASDDDKQQTQTATSDKPKRIYRGQVVH